MLRQQKVWALSEALPTRMHTQKYMCAHTRTRTHRFLHHSLFLSGSFLRVPGCVMSETHHLPIFVCSRTDKVECCVCDWGRKWERKWARKWARCANQSSYSRMCVNAAPMNSLPVSILIFQLHYLANVCLSHTPWSQWPCQQSSSFRVTSLPLQNGSEAAVTPWPCLTYCGESQHLAGPELLPTGEAGSRRPQENRLRSPLSPLFGASHKNGHQNQRTGHVDSEKMFCFFIEFLALLIYY